MCELNALPLCIVSLIKHRVIESFVGAVNCIFCTRPINAVFLLFPHIISCFWHRLVQNNGTKKCITKPSHNRRVLEARFIHPLGLFHVETEGWRGKLCSSVGAFLTQVLMDLKPWIPERAGLFLFVVIVERVENTKRESATFNKSKLKI